MTGTGRSGDSIPPALGSTASRFIREWVLLLLLGGLLVSAMGYQLVARRHTIAKEEAVRLDTQARVIEDNLVRQLTGANNALAAVRYNLISGDVADTGSQALSPWLKVLSDAMPGVRSLLLVDVQGMVIASDHTQLVGMDLHQTQSFRISQQRGDMAAMYVSQPFKSVFGGYSVAIAKTMRGVDGQLSGALIATLDPEYFDKLVRSVFYAPDMRAELIHGDGKVFLAAPHDDAVTGQDAANYGLVLPHGAAHNDATTQLLQGKESDGSDSRFVALHIIQPAELSMDKPLVVAMSRPVQAVYAPWTAEVSTAIAIASLLGLGFAALLFYSQWRRTTTYRQDAQTRAFQELSAKRFEFGLRGADLGLWDWNIATGLLAINERERQMLGYAGDQHELGQDQWRRLVHPDDLPAVQAALDQLLQGHTGSCRVEHRVLHNDGHWMWVLSHSMVMERDDLGHTTRVLGTHLDISERKRAEEVMRLASHRLELAMQSGSIGLLDWDVRSDQLVMNQRARDIVGLADGEPDLSYTAWKSLRHPDEAAEMQVLVVSALASDHGTLNHEFRIRHSDGHYLWVHMRAEVVGRDTSGAPLRIIATIRDVSARIAAQLQLKQANEQLSELSLTDALTGVGNRRLFDRTLAAEWARAGRQRQGLALMMVDIDHFKLYNDHYGHQGGDQCLRVVAEVLAGGFLRATELLTRYGGEEFAVILTPPADPAQASALAQRCLDRMAEAAIPHASSLTSNLLTLSIGVAWMEPNGTLTLDDLIAHADAALYAAKQRGRNRYVLADTSGDRQSGAQIRAIDIQKISL